MTYDTYMENLPTIVQVAAWVYVLKHVIPILLPVLMLPFLYLVLLRSNNGDCKKTNRDFMNSFLEGVLAALKE
jgi:hypothetical protein